MVSLITPAKAQLKLADYTRQRRLAMGLTQAGLAARAGVPLPTLRRFEQKGSLSLEAFLKLHMALGSLDDMIKTAQPAVQPFTSIDEVIDAGKTKSPKRGRMT